MIEDKITSLVIEDLEERCNRGITKYKTTLYDNWSDDFLQHAYEEALDFSQYLKKEMQIRKSLKQLAEDFPNDMEFGKELRKLITK